MPHEIVWEDPPPPTQHQRGKWEHVLNQVKERPGQWARIAEYETVRPARALAHNLKRGHIRKRDGEWEFSTRENRVYARYLGPRSPA